MNFAALTIPLILSQDSSGPVRSIEFEWPASAWQWALSLGALIVSVALVVLVYRKDSVELHPMWRAWLTLLRLAVVAALAVILFNPQERTQKEAYRPSRVAVLADVSLSMSFPETVPDDGTALSDTAPSRSRAEAIAEVFGRKSDPAKNVASVIDELRKTHEVKVYTFDSDLQPQHVYPYAKASDAPRPGAAPPGGNADAAGTGPPKPPETLNWTEMLRPRGLETRLGETLRKLIDEEAGKTLSGIVIVSDGALNAGIDHQAANAAARQAKVRLVAVGVGSTRRQANLKLAGLQAPTDVHVGDPYEITGFVQGQGLAGRMAEVELLVGPAGDDAAKPVVADTREVAILEDGIPVEVKFQQSPSVAGKLKYTVRARPAVKIREADDTDNEESATISIVDKKTRVLLMAGGPTRDYQFVRNMFFRNKSVQHDIWLQTVLPETAGKVSQESDTLLTEFPGEAAELFQYDVIVAFDVDWRKIPADALKLLNRWVAEESGGLVLIAGDVFTPSLANGGDDVKPVIELFPVYLSGTEFIVEREADQAWPFVFSREGEDAGFLQLTDDPQTSTQKWRAFEGVYTCYPTSGEKAGTTVYARFPDPRTGFQGKQPILLASQFYGSGRVLYIGTSELWRLRALSDDCAEYDRLWTKMIREVGQERLTRGAQRAILMPERDKYYIGQTVRVRARILDPQFKPLEAESVALDVIGPDRRPLSPTRKLERDKNRAGQFSGDFRASLPGKYTLELRVPDSSEKDVKEVNVRVPDIESEQREQNANLLTDLCRDTGGRYLRLDEVEKELPALLPNQGETFIVDELLKTLWDREWVLWVLVGVLSIEWLTRKLLKLA